MEKTLVNPEPSILHHAARVLATLTPELPADAALRRYLAGARRLRAGEKRAISRVVFMFFRWREWLEAKQPIARQLEQAAALQTRFETGPAAVKPEALAARAVPAWLREEMELPPDYLRQLQQEPPLWIRARPGTAEKLARELGHCTTTPRAPDALLYRGTQDLFLTPAFHGGAFEIQDLSSQLVALACAPRAGEVWWDACAGEGGKLLHLGDLMGNKGLIWGTDRSERRLLVLRRRAARAQLFNFRTASWDGGARLPTKTKFDGVLLDAPCSGVGTWQRNPHARWTTTPADVAELATLQRSLLEHVAAAVKPGGRLVYAVCTLTRSETTAVADAFQAAHPEYAPLALFGTEPRVTLWPQELNANGMFLAAWTRAR
ncbi:MAG: RsmB/NOP family class I SAM-dependent RNA methyltransferase [Verrucomicrobia bacterium]|nr:RsmB/NOP family class I SAM-dependent RNA methyltransferase [Verrucomicrobiota bacterium]